MGGVCYAGGMMNEDACALKIRELIDLGPGIVSLEEPMPEPWNLIYEAVREEGISYATRKYVFDGVVKELAGRWKYEVMVGGAYSTANAGAGYERFMVKRLNTFSAGEALEPLGPERWLVEGLFRKPSVNLLVGEAGSKKTYAMLDLAVSAAMGEAWLGRAVNWARVLWMDEENGHERMLRRLGQVMRGKGATEDIFFETATMSGLDLRLGADWQILADFVKQEDMEFLVIDSLTGVMPGGDDSRMQHLAALFGGLRKLAERFQMTVLVIHHTNKMGVYRGSSHMRGAVDMMLMAYSTAESNFVEFESGKARDSRSVNFAAEVHFEAGQAGETERVYLTPADLYAARMAVRPGKAFSPVMGHVLRYLEEHGEEQTKGLMASCKTAMPEQVRQAIYQLVNKGLVRRVDEGSRGEMARFGLVR